MPKPPQSKGDTSQRARFIAMAKELGADDDEATFRAKLGAIAKAPRVEDPRDFPSVKKTKAKKRR